MLPRAAVILTWGKEFPAHHTERPHGARNARHTRWASDQRVSPFQSHAMPMLDATNPSWFFDVIELDGELARAWGFEVPMIDCPTDGTSARDPSSP